MTILFFDGAALAAVETESALAAARQDRKGVMSESVEVTVTRTVNKLVDGHDADFWRGSYTLLRDAVDEHLANCLHGDDVAEEAIYIDAIKTAGLQLGAASIFIRDVINALGLKQPEENGIVNLNELALQVVGQIEEYKVGSRGNPVLSEASGSAPSAAQKELTD